MAHFLLIGFTRQILVAFLIYIIYLIFGSLIFVSIESKQEVKYKNKSLELHRLTERMINALRDANFSDDNIYDSFLDEHEYRKSAETPSKPGWTVLYGDKVFFAFILMTTIGYGNESPKSPIGQVACIIFTLIGIPLHVIMMRLLSFKYRGCLRKMFKIAQNIKPNSSSLLVFSGCTYFLFWIAIFLLIPACFFAIFENWSYIKGFYFGFVTLTTIGLGDLVVGVTSDNYDNELFSLNVVLLFIWTLFGLGFLAMAINLLSYMMGVVLIDMLDCKCRGRATVKSQFRSLLDLIKELNWQLVKYRPEGFEDWEIIENFENILTDEPEVVDEELLRKMFYIVIDLKEKAFDELSNLQATEIPLTSTIQQAMDSLTDVLSTQSAIASYSQSEAATALKQNIPGVTDYGSISKESLETSKNIDPVSLPRKSVSSREAVTTSGQKVKDAEVPSSSETVDAGKGTPDTNQTQSTEAGSVEQEDSNDRTPSKEPMDKEGAEK